MRRPSVTPVNIAIAAVGAVVVILVVAQLTLPGLAESRVADELEDIGPRPDVSVSAFPAVKLLFGKADRVEVRMSSARMPSSRTIADQLERTGDADELDVRVATLVAGPLTVRDARLTKDGDQLSSRATVRDSDLRAALPSFLEDVEPSEQQDGQGLLLDGSVAVPIVGSITVQARVQPTQGAIIARPENIPLLGDLATLTVFQDPRVRVTAVGATKREGGFDLTAAGTIVG